MSSQQIPVHVIGGGLAGCEAAFQIASNHIPVVLHEMRPRRMTDAHQTQGLAELVVQIHSESMTQPQMQLVCCTKKCAI